MRNDSFLLFWNQKGTEVGESLNAEICPCQDWVGSVKYQMNPRTESQHESASDTPVLTQRIWQCRGLNFACFPRFVIGMWRESVCLHMVNVTNNQTGRPLGF